MDWLGNLGPVGWIDLAFRIGLILWMARISVLDHRFGLIPNRLTAPVFLGVGLWQIIYAIVFMRGTGSEIWWTRPMFIVLSFGITFALWMLHFIGGGDAKFLMALMAVFPTMQWVVLLALLLLVITLPLLLYELGQRSPGESWRGLRDRILTGQLLPTEDELQERGRRYAWTFAIPGTIFALRYWDGLYPYVDTIQQYVQGTL